MSDMELESGSNKSSLNDLWGDAMSEQLNDNNAELHAAAKDDVMVNFSEDLNLVLDIPVKMTSRTGAHKNDDQRVIKT